MVSDKGLHIFDSNKPCLGDIQSLLRIQGGNWVELLHIQIGKNMQPDCL